MSANALRNGPEAEESALRADSSRVERILGSDPATGAPVDREARLHRRRKNAMVSLLAEFEREIEPHIGPGREQAIENFKRSCREKLNGLTFQAVELMRLERGERFNEAAADLAEHIEFDRNGGTTKP